LGLVGQSFNAQGWLRTASRIAYIGMFWLKAYQIIPEKCQKEIYRIK
jgi:hypothetical protein